MSNVTTTPKTTTVFSGLQGRIYEDAAIQSGVILDKMIVTGPRGGKSVLWRAASKRNYLIASWSHTKADAAKS